MHCLHMPAISRALHCIFPLSALEHKSAYAHGKMSTNRHVDLAYTILLSFDDQPHIGAAYAC